MKSSIIQISDRDKLCVTEKWIIKKKCTNSNKLNYRTMANRRSILLAIGYSVAIIGIVIILAAILRGGNQGIIYPG